LAVGHCDTMSSKCDRSSEVHSLGNIRGGGHMFHIDR